MAVRFSFFSGEGKICCSRSRLEGMISICRPVWRARPQDHIQQHGGKLLVPQGVVEQALFLFRNRTRATTVCGNRDCTIWAASPAAKASGRAWVSRLPSAYSICTTSKWTTRLRWVMRMLSMVRVESVVFDPAPTIADGG